MIYVLPIIPATVPLAILNGLDRDSQDQVTLQTVAGIASACLALIAAVYGILLVLFQPATNAMIAGLIAPLGRILCIVGEFLTATYYFMFAAHFYGLAYNETTRIGEHTS